MTLHVTQASQGAIAAIESQNGQVRSEWMGRVALRYELHPNKFDGRPKPLNPRPPPQAMDYYLSWKNRGYLSPEAQLLEVKQRMQQQQQQVQVQVPPPSERA